MIARFGTLPAALALLALLIPPAAAEARTATSCVVLLELDKPEGTEVFSCAIGTLDVVIKGCNGDTCEVEVIAKVTAQVGACGEMSLSVEHIFPSPMVLDTLKTCCPVSPAPSWCADFTWITIFSPFPEVSGYDLHADLCALRDYILFQGAPEDCKRMTIEVRF